MAVIEPYTSKILASGQIDSHATPDSFGAPEAAAESNLAGGISDINDGMYKLEQDQGRLWAYDAASKAHVALQQRQAERVNSLDPNDPDFQQKAAQLTPALQQDIDNTTSDLMTNAPSRSARKFIGMHMANNRYTLTTQSVAEQAKLAGAYTGKLVADGMKTDQDSIASDPTNDNYDRILASRTQSIGSLQTIDPAQKIKWQEQIEQGLAVTQVQTLAASHPAEFLASVHAQGGRVTPRGNVRGAVPGGAPESDPNTPTPQGLDLSKLTDEQALALQEQDLEAFKRGVNDFHKTGESANLPQVQPLTDQDIAGSKPPISGWGKLTWAQKIAAVRQAEAAVGSGLASDRGVMERDLKDATATLLAGKQYPGLDDPRFSAQNLTRIYGPVDGPRKADQLDYIKQVGGFIGQMNTMPVDQVAATLKTLEPQGGPEFADKNPVFNAARDAAMRIDSNRQKDFMQWAVDNKVANVAPIDLASADNFQKSLHDRIPVANTGATDYRANASLLSKQEADGLGDALNRMNPAQQMQYVKAIKQATNGQGDWTNDVISQIAPKNTMLAQAAAVSTRQGTVTTAAGAQDGNMVGQYIIEGTHILQGKDLEDPTHTGRPLALDDGKFRGMFWNAVGPDAFKSLDADRAAKISRDTYQAVKNYLAADIYHRGLDPRNITDGMVSNAVTAVTGGTTSIGTGDKLFVPWGVPESQFKQQFMVRAQDAINRAGLAGTSLDKLDAYHFTNLADGKYGFMNGGRMLTGRDGRTVVIDFSKGTQSYSGKVGQ